MRKNAQMYILTVVFFLDYKKWTYD